MVAAGTESEVKLDAGVGFSLPALGDVAEDLEVVDLPALRMTATYVDTPDLRLLRAGVTLRHRIERQAGTSASGSGSGSGSTVSGSTGSGSTVSGSTVSGSTLSEWTLKLPRPADGPLVVRRELRWPGTEDLLPPEAEALVAPWRRLAPLAPVARLVQARARTGLRRDGALLVEVDDDVVSVMDGAHLEARFRQLEVELDAGAPRSLLTAVLERLESAGARRGDDRPKLERALGGRGSAPPDVVTPVLTKRATLADVAGAAAARAYLALTACHAGVLLLDDDRGDEGAATGEGGRGGEAGEGGEASKAGAASARVETAPEILGCGFHAAGSRAPVAAALDTCRSASGDLEVLAAVLDPTWTADTLGELEWLTVAVGGLDGAQRLRDALEVGCCSLGVEDRVVATGLVGRVGRESAAALASARVALSSPRFAQLMDRLAVAAATPALRVSTDDAPGSPQADVRARGPLTAVAADARCVLLDLLAVPGAPPGAPGRRGRRGRRGPLMPRMHRPGRATGSRRSW